VHQQLPQQQEFKAPVKNNGYDDLLEMADFDDSDHYEEMGGSQLVHQYDNIHHQP